MERPASGVEALQELLEEFAEELALERDVIAETGIDPNRMVRSDQIGARFGVWKVRIGA